MSKWYSFLLALVVVIGLIGCSAPAEEPEAVEEAPVETVVEEPTDVVMEEPTEENAEGEGAAQEEQAAPEAEADEAPVSGGILIGSVIHLENQFPDEGGYLDSRGRVTDKPAFAEVARTERTFVSTHGSSNRDNGSGSWAIESAMDKEKGTQLVIGDQIYLLNSYPGAGYLDTWGYTDRLDVWAEYDGAILGVYTTLDPSRLESDSAKWFVRSASGKDEGAPVVEGDLIHLESAYPDGGYLDANGRVTESPTFAEYEGQQLLVFTSASEDRQGGSGTWEVLAADTDSTAVDATAPTAEAAAGPIEVGGQVLSATTGQALVGAEVCVGGTDQCATSDGTGTFTLADVPAGEQSLTVTAADHTTLDHSITVNAGGSEFHSLALSPNLETGEIRIVLTWGQPGDLDSYLDLPTPDDGTVYYSRRGSIDSAPFARLDVDSRQLGPETVTIAQRSDGTYQYAVHAYYRSNVVDHTPVVRVYGEAGLIQEFAPPSGDGAWWHVFSMDGATGSLTAIDQVLTSSPFTE